MLRRTAFLAAVFVLTATAALAQAEAQQRTEKARQLVEQGRFEEALREVDASLVEDPDQPMGYLVRGFAYGNLGRHGEARDAFVMAAEMQPGWAQAHQMAAVAAFQSGAFDIAWEQAIKAHQGGIDMTEGFAMLRQAAGAPDDLDRQLNAARMFVMPLSTEKLAARIDNPFSVHVNTGDGATSVQATQPGATPRADNTATSRATSVGKRIIAESQDDFYQLVQQTKQSIAGSASFGLVPRQDMAQYLVLIEVDELEENTPKRMKGYIKLVSPQSGEEIHSMIIELRDISSRADLNADMERYIGLLSDWMERQSG